MRSLSKVRSLTFYIIYIMRFERDDYLMLGSVRLPIRTQYIALLNNNLGM